MQIKNKYINFECFGSSSSHLQRKILIPFSCSPSHLGRYHSDKSQSQTVDKPNDINKAGLKVTTQKKSLNKSTLLNKYCHSPGSTCTDSH